VIYRVKTPKRRVKIVKKEAKVAFLHFVGLQIRFYLSMLLFVNLPDRCEKDRKIPI